MSGVPETREVSGGVYRTDYCSDTVIEPTEKTGLVKSMTMSQHESGEMIK